MRNELPEVKWRKVAESFENAIWQIYWPELFFLYDDACDEVMA